MNRLQKKCLLGSLAFHGLLVAVLFAAPGFLSQRQPESPPPITVIPSKVLDSLLSGGGKPTGAPPPPPVKVEQPLPTPPSPPPQPVAKVEPAPPPVPRPPPEPPKPIFKNSLVPAPLVKKEPVKHVEAEPPPKSKKQNAKTSQEKSKFDTKPKAKAKPSDVRRDTDKKKAVATEDHEAAEAAAAQARAKALAGLKGSIKSLQNNLSSPISAEPLGPGGEAFANYGQIVVSIYQNAWSIPDDVNDDSAVVQATVTIARDGTVVSARLLQGSGRPTVDKSVLRTLDAVKFVQKFPEGARDAQRTFNINFNLKAKRQLG